LTDSTTGDSSNPLWAPRPVFDSILQYTVIATFDLILESPDGVLLVRRRIEPYRGSWALPGLRMLKGESIGACVQRIAWTEVGCRIDPERRVFVNQTVGRFRSQQHRQDVSTCYAFQLDDKNIELNNDNLSGWMFIEDLESAPKALGRVYRDHLEHYFALSRPS
jgi:ADP-ribose pyrophosphatase YjhB (NUDIX family)